MPIDGNGPSWPTEFRSPRSGKPLTDFAPEMVVDGEVKAVMKYGAFVDIGAASDGLVHISQLAEGFVSDPTTIVSVGDKVTVRVLSIELTPLLVSKAQRGRVAREAKDAFKLFSEMIMEVCHAPPRARSRDR